MKRPRSNSAPRVHLALFAGVALCLFVVSGFALAEYASPHWGSVQYQAMVTPATSTGPLSNAQPSEPAVAHLPTPNPLKALYITSWVAGTPNWRAQLIKLVEDTELNAVVIDIKDYSGRISFHVSDPALRAVGSGSNRISDVEDFIRELHAKDVYVIGRVAAFQDAYYVKLHPELAVKRHSDGGVWLDRKGISWIDPGAKPMWEYLSAIAREAHAKGFDEVNFDYIRFPSDGNMTDIAYPFSGDTPKPDVLENFFAYISHDLRPTGMVLSADLFGMTTTAANDLNIGQVFVRALPYFDFVAPMVYPSHYPPGYLGFKNPAAHPYEVVHEALSGAVSVVEEATTTRRITGAPLSVTQIRPWYQDFDLGADYTAPMIRAQIRAGEELGIHSWMLWDPANHYTPSALQSQ